MLPRHAVTYAFKTSGVSPASISLCSSYTSRFNQTSPLATDRPVSKSWAVPYDSVVCFGSQLLKICGNQNGAVSMFCAVFMTTISPPICKKCLWIHKISLLYHSSFWEQQTYSFIANAMVCMWQHRHSTNSLPFISFSIVSRKQNH